METEIYNLIIKRHKSLAENCYINIFAGDDQKKQHKIYSNIYNLKEKTVSFIKNEIEIFNIGSYGVFMNFNLLEKPQRNHNNITKILYVFIDLDDAKQEHNDLIKQNLEAKGIKYCYNAKSGHGYHFLVPVLFSPDKKDKVKGFLTFLKNNVCDKVDIATHTNERLIRCPNSYHNKDSESKKLETLYVKDINEEDILLNNELVLKFQEENIKTKNNIYVSTLTKKDLFFSSILQDTVNWSKYYNFLDKSKDRNNNFIKNLGFFLYTNPEYYNDIELFLNNWEKSRFQAVLGWSKKAEQNKYTCNYYELMKWSLDNGIELFVSLLKEQLKTDVLDEYEVYYLEDEKKENCYLLYYPEKNYFVQKSSNELLINIYYDIKDRGIDLEKEFNFSNFIDKWSEKSQSEKEKIFLSHIYTKLSCENRIKKVFNIGYEPSDNKFIHFNNKVYFNTYSKTNLWDYYKKQETYNFPKIKELILNLCGKNEYYFLYFCKWLAWQIKNPEIKLPTAIILQGKQGSGKGTLKDLILDNIFGDNCQEINQTHLESSFNDFLLGKQIIVANEVMHNENKQTLPNILKNLVTDKKITINRKFLKSVTGANYTHWIFCTNSDNPIKIDEDDRRYSVFYSEKLRPGLPRELRENLDYELKEFICFLKDLEVVFEEVSEPIMTEAKEEIIELNRDSVDKFNDFLKQFNNLQEAFISIYGNDFNYYIKDDFGDNCGYITTEKVYLLYEKWCQEYKEKGIFAKQNFSKRLSNKGIKSKPKRLDGKIFKMYSLEDFSTLVGAKNE